MRGEPKSLKRIGTGTAPMHVRRGVHGRQRHASQAPMTKPLSLQHRVANAARWSFTSSGTSS